MLLVVCLSLWALSVRGDLPVRLEPVVYTSESGVERLELGYEIPFRSLAFVRQGQGYAARCRVALEALDGRGRSLSADFQTLRVSVAEYGATSARESVVSGVLATGLPAAARRGRVVVTDELSERQAVADFVLNRPTGGMTLRLADRRSSYRPGDTLVALAEIVGPNLPLESCRFRVLSGGRVVMGSTVAATESLGRRVAVYRLAIGPGDNGSALVNGDYLLQAVAGSATGIVGFRVEVSFFLDDRAWARRVEQLIYVAEPAELRRLVAMPREEREQAWRDFWKQRDDTPTTERNEREEEYFARIAYAEEHFGHGDRGFRSDRGRVYVYYGSPDQIEARPFEIDRPAREVWYYYELNKRFIFVDRFGTGEYLLQNPEALDGR